MHQPLLKLVIDSLEEALGLRTIKAATLIRKEHFPWARPRQRGWDVTFYTVLALICRGGVVVPISKARKPRHRHVIGP